MKNDTKPHDIYSYPGAVYILYIIDQLGYYGPFILIFMTIIVLKKRSIFYHYYLVGYVANMILNNILRAIWKQPRPNTNQELFNMKKANNKELNPHQYGMPSGHAQGVAYSTSFIALLTQKHKDLKHWTLIFVAISALTVGQRIIKKDHSVEQVGVGLILGAAFGYLVFVLSEKKVMGCLLAKDDEYNYCPENMTQ